MGALRELRIAANRRYLEFLSAIDDPSKGIDKLNKFTRTVHEEARSYRGFNFFDQQDETLFLALARGEFSIQVVALGLKLKVLVIIPELAAVPSRSFNMLPISART